MSLAPGSNLGPYRIIEPLGRGGMATVFRAYEAGLDRYIALKVLPKEFLHDETFAARFRKEARTLAGLEHPKIVPIYAYGIEDNTPWMAMRLVTGGTLASLARKGRLSPSRILSVLGGVAEALDYAHARGIVHRDIKPQNVLLDEQEQVYLADFGIAKMVEGGTLVTQKGVITGTPHYMAPEQVSGDTIDGRCDVYALGIITYELLTGHVPFSADTPVAVLMKHITEPIPLKPLAGVPEPLMRAVLKAVAKKADDRFPTAGAFLAAMGQSFAPAAKADPPTVEIPAGGAGLDTTASLPRTEGGPGPDDLEPTAVRPEPPSAAGTRPTAVRPGTRPSRPPLPQGAARKGFGPALLGLVAAGGVGVVALAAGGAWILFGSPTPPTTLSSPRPVASPAAPVSSPSTPSPSPQSLAGIGASLLPSPLPPPLPSSTIASRPATPRPTPETTRAASTPPRQAPQSSIPTPPPPTAPAAPGRLQITIDAERVVAGARALPLYIRVLVDGQVKANTAVIFSGRPPAGDGGNAVPVPYTGSETVDIDGVSAGPHRVEIVAGTERSLSDGVTGSTEVTVRSGVNHLSADIRFAGPRRREVRLR